MLSNQFLPRHMEFQVVLKRAQMTWRLMSGPVLANTAAGQEHEKNDQDKGCNAGHAKNVEGSWTLKTTTDPIRFPGTVAILLVRTKVGVVEATIYFSITE